MRPLPFNNTFIGIDCKFVITCMYGGEKWDVTSTEQTIAGGTWLNLNWL